jgi:adenylate kinase family enzyme
MPEAEPQRIVVVSSASGSGKTTVARALAARLGTEHVELDALVHGPGWIETPDDELRARIEPVVASAAWVIDGSYQRKLGDLVLGAATTIVWLDLPLHTKMRRLWRRTLGRIHGELELWNDNVETWRGAFWGRESLFVWALRSHFRHRRDWPRRFDGDRRLVRLRSEEAAREWLERLLA